MSGRIVIVGGGFAGTWAALLAARQAADAGADLEIEMIAPEPYLVMRPRLYEKDPENLRAPLAPVLDPIGVSFVAGKVSGIDIAGRAVTVARDGTTEERGYDRLIVATGSRLASIPVPGLAEHGFDIDSYAAAVAFDDHLKRLAKTDAPGRDTFVIVGGGFTGIELAAELRDRIAVHDADLAEHARIVVIEKAAAIGPELGAGPRPVIERALAEAGVEVRLGTAIGAVDGGGVALATGERIEAATVVSTAGLRAGPLAEALPGAHDELGRVVVDDFLRVPEAPGVFAAGDTARAVLDEAGNVALMSCQHALRTGRYAGHNAARELLGLPLTPYRQPSYTTCLDLGRFGAVATRGWEREVQAAGAEAKARKIDINRNRIYPPTGTREEILAAAEMDLAPVK